MTDAVVHVKEGTCVSGIPGCFGRISEIQAEDEASWQDRSFLSFDIDWAHDDIVHDCIDLVEEMGVKATWFATHQSPTLDRLRANPDFEIGIHPNFLFLLNGDPRNGGTVDDVLDRVLEWVPDAKAVRSHSLVSGGRLLEAFARRGLTHEGNVFLPAQSGIAPRPWVDWFGMTRVPHIFQDDFWFGSGLVQDKASLAGLGGFACLDFHPIHLFLNTDHLNRYEAARADFRDPAKLRERRCAGEGARTLLRAVVTAKKERYPAA